MSFVTKEVTKMKLVYFLTILIILNCTANAQIGINDGCWPTHQRGNIAMLRMSFDSVIRSYIQKYNRQQVIDSTDIILIVKLSNTLSFNRNIHLTNCYPDANNLYKLFMATFTGRFLYNKLNEIAGACIPNLGMGCYYKKYNLDWGGASPNENSLIKVLY